MSTSNGALRVLLLALAACGGNTYRANLVAQASSIESGFVTVQDNGSGALAVTVSLGPVPAGTTQPSHIHNGQCGSNGSLNQELQPLANASNLPATVTMTTAVNVSYQSLKDQSYVDVHESFTNPANVVACANLH
jgi:hypothetical protein